MALENEDNKKAFEKLRQRFDLLKVEGGAVSVSKAVEALRGTDEVVGFNVPQLQDKMRVVSGIRTVTTANAWDALRIACLFYEINWGFREGMQRYWVGEKYTETPTAFEGLSKQIEIVAAGKAATFATQNPEWKKVDLLDSLGLATV